MDSHLENKKNIDMLCGIVRQQPNKLMLTMLVGLPCAGKTRYANKILDKDTIYVNGKDNTRFRQIVKAHLKNGRNVIYDNNNLLSRKRRTFLGELDGVDCYKKCVIIATPYEQCLKNNKLFSKEEIDNAYRSWNTPFGFEGWDEIEVVYNQVSEESRMKWREFPWSHIEYNQYNPHHNMTLGNHCIAAGKYLTDNGESYWLRAAGYLHDIGKIHCQSINDGVASYHRHENVGAYEALFFDEFNWADSLYISLLVNLHMYPHWWAGNKNKDKLHEKYRKIWGEDVYNNVMKLHEADRKAK